MHTLTVNYIKSIVRMNSLLMMITVSLHPLHNNRYNYFNDNNQLYGFVYPIVDKKELKDKFNINNNIWITKVGNGYCIANLKEDKWIYIEL